MLAQLEDPDRGGFFAHTKDPEAVGTFAERRKPIEENGLAARFLVELHHRLPNDDSPYLDAARRALEAVGSIPAVHQQGRIVGTYLLALEELELLRVEVTVSGDREDPRTEDLLATAVRWYEPRAIVRSDSEHERYPDIGRPAVYLCTDTACSSPITDPRMFIAKANAFVETAL
jgi:hypothetical protein